MLDNKFARIIAVGSVLVAGIQPAFAAWEFKTIQDPMTDASRGISVLRGEGGSLVIKCDENGADSLYISVISNEYLGGVSGKANRELKYRADGGEIQSVYAYHDGRSATVIDLKTNSAGAKFLMAIGASKKFVVQATSYDYKLSTIVFDTTGAPEAIKKAATTCGDTRWAVGY